MKSEGALEEVGRRGDDGGEGGDGEGWEAGYGMVAGVVGAFVATWRAASHRLCGQRRASWGSW